MAVAQQARVNRQYGFGIKGCVTSLDRHEISLDSIGPDSREMLIKPPAGPEFGKAARRHGAAGIGSATGVLEMAVAKATMKGIEGFEIQTSISSDGYPVLGQIWADESKRYGQLFIKDGSADYTYGEEFGTTHYPIVANGQSNIKRPPVAYDGNGATGYSRGAFEEARRHLFAGTRRHVGFKNREYFGGFMSAPTNITREWNTSSGSGTNNARHFPTGLIMPLRPPDHTTYPTKHAGPGPWQEGDRYFEAWAFEYEDGSVSMPTIPRDINTTLTTGRGLVTVADAGTAQYYDYVPDENIPIGPPGTKNRRKYRTDKVSKASGAWPDLRTLKLVAIVEGNSSTTYNDPLGRDGAAFADPLLRTDQVWPDRGRYDFACDQRHGTGYLRRNPYCLVIAPFKDAAGTNPTYFQDDDAGLVGNFAWAVQIRQTSAGALTLKTRFITLGGGAPTDSSFTLASNKTLQQLVDEINASVIGSGSWGVEIVPGCPANIPSDQIAPSHIDSAGGTWTNASTTLNLTSTTDIAEGMKVNDPKWPAGTYVERKVSATQLTMSAQSTAAQAAPADVEFYCDTGDDGTFTDATAHSQFGNMRAWGNCVPVIVALKQSYLATFPTEKRDFQLTAGGPLAKPNAAHLFHTSPGGRYSAESAAGIFMGGAPLHAGFVAFYSNWIGWYHNVRSGSTGDDEHYRMDWIVQDGGCASPYSIVFGNGWVGCWRAGVGFWIFDGEKSSIISYDHYLRTAGGAVGDMVYENDASSAAAQADSDDYYFQASYVQGRLWLNVRISAGVGSTFCYDASASQEASGINQMLRPDGSPFGWSTRCSYSWRSFAAGCLGAIAAVRKSDGIHLYQADDKNDKTNCGLVQEFETTGTYLDGADPVQWQLWLRCDLIGGLRKHSLASPLLSLFKNTVSSGSTGVSATIYRNQARSASVGLVVPLSDTVFGRKALNLGLKAGSPGEITEIKWAGGAASNERIFELAGIEVPADILESVT